MNSEIHVGIAGLGNVGASVFRLIEENAEVIACKLGKKVIVTAVSARNKGKKRDVDLGKVTWYENPVALATDPNVDIVVELMGGEKGAAFDLIIESIKNNKKIVTANKALLAMRGVEIYHLLQKHHSAKIYYEAAVGGGIPCIKTLREGLVANNINTVYGILNGTCNFILSEMAETGRSFEDVLKEAQDLGYAEADPSFDIDGNDAGHKLAILSALAFKTLPDFNSIKLSGIRNITALDIEIAQDLGYVIKLLAVARKNDEYMECFVEPCMISESSMMAGVNGAMNAVCFDTDYAGKILMTGAGAGGNATASAVVSDIVSLANGGVLDIFQPSASHSCVLDKKGEYFVRLDVKDNADIMAEVTSVFQGYGVDLRSIFQFNAEVTNGMSLILITKLVKDRDIMKAISDISHLINSSNFIKIENL